MADVGCEDGDGRYVAPSRPVRAGAVPPLSGFKPAVRVSPRGAAVAAPAPEADEDARPDEPAVDDAAVAAGVFCQTRAAARELFLFDDERKAQHHVGSRRRRGRDADIP